MVHEYFHSKACVFTAPDIRSAHMQALTTQKYQQKFIPIKYKQHPPTHTLPKVQLYIAVKSRNIYRVTSNDY